MPADDRDTKFERALEQHLRAGSLAAGCPDEETLAAYHEHSLSLEEMAYWKQHIAGCARCQEALSLVEVTEKQLAEEWLEQSIPVMGAAAVPQAVAGRAMAKAEMPALEAPARSTAPVVITRRPKLARWTIPIGAVAAGVLVWIGVHQMTSFRAGKLESVQIAENRPAASPAPSTDLAVAPKPEPPAAKDRESAMRKEREGAARIVPPPAEKESTGALVAPITADAPVQNKVAKKQVAPDAPRPAGGFVAASPPAPPTKVPPPPPPSAATETVEVNGSASAVETEGKTVDLPVGGVAGGAATDQKHVAAVSKSKSAAQPQAAPQQQAANINTNAMMLSQGVSRAMTQISTLSSAVIVTPDNKVWWKIGANGSVELTTDTGKNWKTLSTGVTAQLTSGSAPSSEICWIAGQAGTLVLTTDRGRHWTRVTTPISGDLGGVHAGDARHATIWDSANRLSYETSDGGAAWKQVANE